MLTADLRHAVLAAARRRGYPVPPPGDPVLRPGGSPGQYITALPPRLAPRDPRPLAKAMAADLRRLAWIASATPAPLGYLTIVVTDEALERLAIRVATAGPACAGSDARHGTTLPAPRTARDGPWAEAHTTVLFQVTAALGRAAGASVPADFLSRRSGAGVTGFGDSGPVRETVEFAGPEAIRYTLARTPAEHLVPPDPQIAARHIEANPAYAVQYAYSCAATTLRWAADLGLSRGSAEQFRPGSLAHPRERALLDVLSWLPEQVARAARRGRPHEFTTFCEELAETYQVCRVTCPAWPEREPVVRARLWLTGAVAVSLAAGLELLGVSAPGRL
ncbi:MAG TPA: DALR anticodon-binding domain-containing protein [Streptosporangiaceae bacterium]|nr:DALR anticodon-binding domain-containing protein [Streptosporangiaceae bacterium]